jgi:hypothetical protein
MTSMPGLPSVQLKGHEGQLIVSSAFRSSKSFMRIVYVISQLGQVHWKLKFSSKCFMALLVGVLVGGTFSFADGGAFLKGLKS